MLPWVPFFVFSQHPPPQKSKHRPNFLEEVLEVRAISANVEKLHNGPSYEMLYHLTKSNRSKSAPFLPKTSAQNVRIEFEDAIGAKIANISSENGEKGEDEFVSLKNRCHTIASTSTPSASREAKMQNGESGRHSPTPSSKQQSSSSSPAEPCDNSIRRTVRRRTAFETSEAMREIFGASLSMSAQQKENFGEFNRKKVVIENRRTTNGTQQNGKRVTRPSELEDETENRDLENMSLSVSEASSEVGSVSFQDGAVHGQNKRPLFENGVTKRNVRLKSDLRISPASSGSWEKAIRPVSNKHQGATPLPVGRRPAVNAPRAAVCWYCGVKGHAAAHCQKKRRKGQ